MALPAIVAILVVGALGVALWLRLEASCTTSLITDDSTAGVAGAIISVVSLRVDFRTSWEVVQFKVSDDDG